MTERLPDNLELLYSAFSKEAIDGIFGGEAFFVSDVEFVCKYSPESTAERFFIVKPLELVEQYRGWCREFQGGAIMELGIAEGGSTALIALDAKPSKLIAVDLEPKPLAALTTFAETHGLSDTLRPHYGVDQGDRARLREIVHGELGGQPLDLVFDDASHKLDLTRSSFETLFPLIRPGGLFVIDDWRADHIMRDAVIAGIKNQLARGETAGSNSIRESVAAAKRGEKPKLEPPLSQLAIELLLSRAAIGDAITQVAVDEWCLVVRRGPGELDPESFRVADLFTDYFGFLPSNVGPGSTSG